MTACVFNANLLGCDARASMSLLQKKKKKTRKKTCIHARACERYVIPKCAGVSSSNEVHMRVWFWINKSHGVSNWKSVGMQKKSQRNHTEPVCWCDWGDCNLQRWCFSSYSTFPTMPSHFQLLSPTPASASPSVKYTLLALNPSVFVNTANKDTNLDNKWQRCSLPMTNTVR